MFWKVFIIIIIININIVILLLTDSNYLVKKHARNQVFNDCFISNNDVTMVPDEVIKYCIDKANRIK